MIKRSSASACSACGCPAWHTDLSNTENVPFGDLLSGSRVGFCAESIFWNALESLYMAKGCAAFFFGGQTLLRRL